jgi:hypothetical protein
MRHPFPPSQDRYGYASIAIGILVFVSFVALGFISAIVSLIRRERSFSLSLSMLFINASLIALYLLL